MLEHIRLSRGLDIPVEGVAELTVHKTIAPEIIAMKPTDFKGVTPKLTIKEGDTVKAGSIIFIDKKHPEIGFSSPCSGTIESIVRGEKRKLLEVRIKADKTTDYINFQVPDLFKATKNDVTKLLLESGLWATVKQRPYGIIANPADEPKAIFISGFNSAPLASDLNYILKDDIPLMQTAIDELKKLTSGAVHIGLDSNNYAASPLYKLKDVTLHVFDGPHPAGNVGIQIHHISPIKKGEIIWTINAIDLVAIGKLFKKGIYDMSRTIAIAGPRVKKPCYVKSIPGMPVKEILDLVNTQETELYGQPVGIRYISGDILTGEKISEEGFLGFYDNLISVISEGNYYELFGWAKPFRTKKFSLSHSYFSWLCPKKRYNPDTNMNGGHRAFVVNGLYEKVLPMDIYPVFLLKAILAEDIDKMENLGIYEVIEEDLALCEYVCPSKIDVQNIIAKGIDIMIKEMA
jgi:Na+-transporting NADH:ubiquinone oxidoreductase subunit A